MFEIMAELKIGKKCKKLVIATISEKFIMK